LPIAKASDRMDAHCRTVPTIIAMPVRGGYRAGMKPSQGASSCAPGAAVPEHSAEAPVAEVEIFKESRRKEFGCYRFARS